MAVFFRSLCSGSSGNAVMVGNERSRILIDCGVNAQYRFREMLDEYAPAGLDAVVVSHLHSDHVNYASLRVLEERGVPALIHEENADGLSRHFKTHPFHDLRVQTFDDESFAAGAFEIWPLRVPHAPWLTTHAFVVSERGRRPGARIVVATDLCEWGAVADEAADADVLYLEANHDPELLRKYPNPNSEFHLENSSAGGLLAAILGRSRRAPQAVVLAHLSAERNRPQLARKAVLAELRRAGCEAPPVSVAPRFEASDEIVIGE